MKYPEKERILIVRPCLKAICLGIRPASKLLSLLLFYAKDCDEQEATFTFSCTQEELVADLIEEMDVKTLHRTAVPMLRLLGFIEVDGSSYRYRYTVHLDLIQHAINHYKNKEQLDKILIVSMREQLDKYRNEIDKCPNELDKILIELDKCLIPFRKMSNSNRGRKPRPKEALAAVSKSLDNLDITQIDSDNRDSLGVSANASTPQTQFKNPLNITLPVANGYKKHPDDEESQDVDPSQSPPAQPPLLAAPEQAQVAPVSVLFSLAEPPEPSHDSPQESSNVPAEAQKGKGKRNRSAKVIPIGPPVLPASDAQWCAEIAVEIVEAKKGRRYGETTRAQELTEARKVLKLEWKDAPITREQFERAWDDMTSWPFWKEHTNVKPMIKYLRRDDKIITVLEELETKSRKSDRQKPPQNQSNGHHIPSSLQGLEDLTYEPPPLIMPRQQQPPTAAVARR